jgi:hypothetical protein
MSPAAKLDSAVLLLDMDVSSFQDEQIPGESFTEDR